jgi:hypothetical protein
MRENRRLTASDLKHVIDNQIDPQERAARLREQGIKVDVAFVNTSPEAPGFEVQCRDCGRTARVPDKPAENAVAICPQCMRAKGYGGQ